MFLAEVGKDPICLLEARAARERGGNHPAAQPGGLGCAQAALGVTDRKLLREMGFWNYKRPVSEEQPEQAEAEAL